MAWRIEFHPDAVQDISKLDRPIQKRIIGYLKERIAKAGDPRSFGKALTGKKKDLWRYRVGDYWIICDVRSQVLLVLVVKVGHRSNVYY